MEGILTDYSLLALLLWNSSFLSSEHMVMVAAMWHCGWSFEFVRFHSFTLISMKISLDSQMIIAWLTCCHNIQNTNVQKTLRV